MKTSSLHDPGGKVRLKLQFDVRGEAEFSECGKYRHSLSRRWDEGDTWIPFMLWIGMNPSTAEAHVDDPTVRREIGFTRRDGYFGYLKCNVMDYRATDPDALLADGVEPCSSANLDTIVAIAAEADVIVAAWGSLPKRLRPYADRVEDILRELGHPLKCLGRTKSGAPRHPLYVKSITKLENY